jgi:hypothetical protein
VAEAHARHFSERRIRLLGRLRVHARAHPALLRTAIERRARCLPTWRFTPSTHKLIERRHKFPLRERNSVSWPNPIRAWWLRTGPCPRRRNTGGTSGPHSRTDPPGRRVVAQEQETSRETLQSYPKWSPRASGV